jgi:site-specific recombinase XerD
MQTFAQFLRDNGKAESTVTEYQRRLKGWRAFLTQRQVGLKNAQIADVRAYRDFMVEKGDVWRTINAKLSTICCYYDYLLAYEAVAKNPVVAGLKVRGKAPKLERLTDEQLHAALMYFDGMQPNLRAAWYAMYATGARVGEITALRQCDIKVQNGRVYLDIRDAKWGSDRCVPIIDERAAKIVYEYWMAAPIADERLFRVSKRTMQEIARGFAESTGIGFWCHLLRHTFAARLCEQGVAMPKIQFMLGHKSLSMTAHYTESALIDVSSIAPSIFQERGNGGSMAPEGYVM